MHFHERKILYFDLNFIEPINADPVQTRYVNSLHLEDLAVMSTFQAHFS